MRRLNGIRKKPSGKTPKYLAFKNEAPEDFLKIVNRFFFLIDWLVFFNFFKK